MDTPAPDLSQSPEVDLHRLELRFAEARLLEPRAIEALARSIEQSGQLMACIAVPAANSNRLILVDGYRRVQALRRLGRDTARVQSWACDLAQALLTVLAQAGRRPFAAIEEALLVRELVRGQGLAEREVHRAAHPQLPLDLADRTALRVAEQHPSALDFSYRRGARCRQFRQHRPLLVRQHQRRPPAFSRHDYPLRDSHMDHGYYGLFCKLIGGTIY